jgi:hypothetical protein
MGVQKHYKKRFAKKIVSKSLYKKIDKKSKTDFFSNFLYHVFGRFSVREVQKHDKKYWENKSDPIPFSYSDPPTQGVTEFFVLPAPWFSACVRLPPQTAKKQEIRPTKKSNAFLSPYSLLPTTQNPERTTTTYWEIKTR